MAIINKNIKTDGTNNYYSNTTFFNITIHPSDIYLRLTEGTRLDTVADKIYGDDSLWWLIASINNLDLSDYCISDEIVIRIPSPSRLPRILSEIKNNQKG